MPGRHPWLPVPYAATKPDVICLFQRGELSIVRTHASPSDAVQSLLERLPTRHAVRDDQIAVLSAGAVHRYPPDLYLLLGARDFRPASSEGVRRLDTRDAESFELLHAAVDPRHRWYVELDHPIVFGLFTGDLLVAAASHFLFEDFGVAAPGVFTHPEYRRLGHGTAVVSAAVAWALERSFLVEWSTNEANIGSLAVASGLGFQPFALETEFRIGEPSSPAA